MRKSSKKLLIEVDELLHADIKMRASERYMTMKQWILQALFEKRAQEDIYNKEPQHEDIKNSSTSSSS